MFCAYLFLFYFYIQKKWEFMNLYKVLAELLYIKDNLLFNYKF